MLWNPLLQFGPVTCLYDECSSVLHTTSWKCGQTGSLQPRLIHELDYVVLLVSAVWSCDNNHYISSTDPRIIDLVHKKYGFQPFILLHKTGFTTSFVLTVIELIKEGITFNGMEHIVRQKRQQHVASVSEMVLKNSACKYITHISVLASEAINLLQYPLPSDDVFHKCFIVHFLKYQHAYNAYMSSVPIKNVISVDHTFKVPSNIGYCRPDKKWVKLYTSVFICMNGIGQIVGWQFTATTSIDEVHALLMHIKSRMQPEGKKIEVFVDNCCSVRNKLQEIFGNDALIKLDVFHAIQRITRKLPKRHPFFRQCKNELKLVVRNPSDIGEDRKQDTTTPKQMIENLHDFETKWTTCNKNGWYIIHDGTEVELASLKSHIRKGCLSGISPGHGTNRNEVLHRHINPRFSNKCKIGLPLALALLAILLHVHNTKIEEKITGSPSFLISNNQSQETYHYGVSRKYDTPDSELPSWITSDIEREKIDLTSQDFQCVNKQSSTRISAR